MPQPEKKIVDAIVRYLKELQRSPRACVWFLKIHGSPMQRAGVPDLLVVIDGHAVFLEVKTETGKVTKLQEHTMKKLREARATAVVVRSVDDASRCLIELKKLYSTKGA